MFFVVDFGVYDNMFVMVLIVWLVCFFLMMSGGRNWMIVWFVGSVSNCLDSVRCFSVWFVLCLILMLIMRLLLWILWIGRLCFLMVVLSFVVR